jgi:aromatic-L-amino-acid/L-tryptophan decarboxylase
MSSILDSDPEEFRRAGHEAIDWIADFLTSIDRRPVLSRWSPGEVGRTFSSTPSEEGRSYGSLLEDFRSRILPGVTHWNHPAFFAYFAITGSQAGILGELLSAALNVNGMVWRSSPVATELETHVLEWLRGALGLPEGLFGIINDTASINTFLALAAAREATGLEIRAEGMSGRTLPQLRVYCSDQAHSSVEKAALALGFGVRGVTKIASDAGFSLDAGHLAAAIENDQRSGVIPCAVVGTAGTTSTSSFDPIAEMGEIARAAGAWLHVDAAYAGSAMLDPTHRHFWRGVESADSLVVNPHKWLFTQVDCSVLFTRRPDVLRETFSLVPEYLRTPEPVTNYMDYGLQLGRRFRALKLWMVLEHYGLTRLRQTISQHIDFAKRLAESLLARDDVELLAPQRMSVVVFRKLVRSEDGRVDEAASERKTEALLERMNQSGEVFVSHTRLRGTYGIRVAIGNGATTWEHVARILAFV